MQHPTHEELIDYLFQELDPAKQSELASHLDACGECRDRVASWRGTRAALQTWELPEQPQAIARRSETPLRIMRWAAAAMIMLGLGYGVGRTSARSADIAQLHADLRREMQSQLASIQTTQQEDFRRAIIQAADQLESRRLADYASLRKDVETVAYRTQAEFDSLAAPEK